VYNVFISCNSEDYSHAKAVYDHLVWNGRNAFFCEATLREKGKADRLMKPLRARST